MADTRNAWPRHWGPRPHDQPSRIWLDDAKCQTMNPEDFDMASQPGAREAKHDRAAALCAGCPVIVECAVDALWAADLWLVRAGVWCHKPVAKPARLRAVRELVAVADQAPAVKVA